VVANAGKRYFGPPYAGPSSDNRIELTMQGTSISSLSSDLSLTAAVVGSPSTEPGDGNVLWVLMRGVTGSGHPSVYADVLGATSAEFTGEGNQLEIMGNQDAFARTNSALVPLPPTGSFTSPEGP
jgi:hypothetical protein